MKRPNASTKQELIFIENVIVAQFDKWYALFSINFAYREQTAEQFLFFRMYPFNKELDHYSRIKDFCTMR